MAKLITLNLGGVPVYPNTVTDAIADVASRKRLSDIIAELQSKPAGDSYSIVKDSESNLVYRLMKNGTEVSGEINIAAAKADVVAEAKAYTDNAVSAEDVAIKAWVNGVLEGAVYAEPAGDKEYLDITAILGTTVSTPATFASVLNKGTEAKAVLVEDVDLVEPITITPKMSATADGDAAQYTITVDLNGKKVTCASGNAFVNMDPNAKLVIKNGEIEAKNAIAHAEGGKVVIESGTYKSTNNAPLTVGDNGVIVVNGGSFVGSEGAVITSYAQGADIEINGGTFTATDNLVLSGNGSSKNPAGVIRTEGNRITVNGGTFNGAIKTSGYIAGGVYSPWKDEWTLNGGVFNVTNGCGICARAGHVTIGKNVVFNVTGTTAGWVGDKKTSVPCAAIIYDESANYPGQDETSKITVNSAVIANSTVSESQDKVVVMKTGGNVAEADGVRVVVAK